MITQTQVNELDRLYDYIEGISEGRSKYWMDFISVLSKDLQRIVDQGITDKDVYGQPSEDLKTTVFDSTHKLFKNDKRTT